MATIDCLPDHVIQIILLKLPLIDVFSFMRLNKTWYSEGAMVVKKRGTQLLETAPGHIVGADDDLGCSDPNHKKKDPYFLQVNGGKLKWRQMKYILKKMGGGLQVLNVFDHHKKAMICAGDFTPKLECLEVEELQPPFKPLPYLKHLYGKSCFEDFLHRLDEFFPSLEVLNVGYLDPQCNKSLQARFRRGMTSISLPGIDLYELSQWPALETLKTLFLCFPSCSRIFSFRAPLLEEFVMGMANLNQQYHDCLVISLLKSCALKNLSLCDSTIDVSLTKQLLSGLPHLVNVSFNCLIDDEAISIIRTTANNIEEMHLTSASVTDSSLEHLKNLPRLQKVFIGVTSNGFTFEALRKFCLEIRQPDGKIRFDFEINQENLSAHLTEFNDFPNFRLRKKYDLFETDSEEEMSE